jgi:hypothetical protein
MCHKYILYLYLYLYYNCLARSPTTCARGVRRGAVWRRVGAARVCGIVAPCAIARLRRTMQQAAACAATDAGGAAATASAAEPVLPAPPASTTPFCS